LIGIAPHSAVSITGAFVVGAFGSLVLILVPTVLAALHHGSLGIALGEASLAASVGGSLAPLVVGWSATTGLGWRGAAGLVVILVCVLALLFRSTAIPSRPHTETGESARLPLTYWAYWLALLFAIAVEFCIALWSASFLEQVVGMSRAAAASGVSVFLVAVLVARLAGSRIAARWASGSIFQVSLVVTVLGVSLYWAGGAPLPALVGLGISGLGIANLYPHGVALALAAAPGQVRLASARASLTSGLAIMGAPLLLGNLADRIGINAAQVVIVLFLVLAFAACQVGNLLQHRASREVSH
jgi:fucose permease